MVSTAERDGTTWCECDRCGMLFDNRGDADRHEAGCDAEEPSYIR